MEITPLFIPGGPELIIIFMIAVLLFGSTKLPKLARAAGESMGEFQKGRTQIENELREMAQGEPKAEPNTQPEPTVVTDVDPEAASVAE